MADLSAYRELLEQLKDPPAWHDQSACQDVDTKLFYSDTIKGLRLAQARGCPIFGRVSLTSAYALSVRTTKSAIAKPLVNVRGRIFGTHTQSVRTVVGAVVYAAWLLVESGLRASLGHDLGGADVEEFLAERGIAVDHVTTYRWVQRFTPMLVDAAHPCRHSVGGRWFVDETYVKVAGRWRYVYRAVDEYGQVIDVYVSARRDIAAARRFFVAALAAHGEPDEVVTGLAPALETAIVELVGDVFHNTVQYANNRVECDHGRLKARLRPMRGLKTDRTAQVVISGHALIQNLRRGHYELAVVI